MSITTVNDLDRAVATIYRRLASNDAAADTGNRVNPSETALSCELGKRPSARRQVQTFRNLARMV